MNRPQTEITLLPLGLDPIKLTAAPTDAMRLGILLAKQGWKEQDENLVVTALTMKEVTQERI